MGEGFRGVATRSDCGKRGGRVRLRIDKCCQFLLVLPFLAGAWAQAADSPAIIERVAVERQGPRVEVKIVLSRAVTPVAGAGII